MIKKIWQDPVWSKVISVGIIGLLSLVYAKSLSVTENLSFKEAINKILEIKVAVVYVFVILIIYWIISWFFRKETEKNSSIYSKKQRTLMAINKTTDPSAGLSFKWNVFFNHGTPIISDLTVFCTLHGEPPIRFMDNRCSVRGCLNSRQPIDKYELKNLIESDLIDKWEKLK